MADSPTSNPNSVNHPAIDAVEPDPLGNRTPLMTPAPLGQSFLSPKFMTPLGATSLSKQNSSIFSANHLALQRLDDWNRRLQPHLQTSVPVKNPSDVETATLPTHLSSENFGSPSHVQRLAESNLVSSEPTDSSQGGSTSTPFQPVLSASVSPESVSPMLVDSSTVKPIDRTNTKRRTLKQVIHDANIQRSPTIPPQSSASFSLETPKHQIDQPVQRQTAISESSQQNSPQQTSASDAGERSTQPKIPALQLTQQSVQRTEITDTKANQLAIKRSPSEPAIVTTELTALHQPIQAKENTDRSVARSPQEQNRISESLSLMNAQPVQRRESSEVETTEPAHLAHRSPQHSAKVEVEAIVPEQFSTTESFTSHPTVQRTEVSPDTPVTADSVLEQVTVAPELPYSPTIQRVNTSTVEIVNSENTRSTNSAEPHSPQIQTVQQSETSKIATSEPLSSYQSIQRSESIESDTFKERSTQRSSVLKVETNKIETEQSKPNQEQNFDSVEQSLRQESLQRSVQTPDTISGEIKQSNQINFTHQSTPIQPALQQPKASIDTKPSLSEEATVQLESLDSPAIQQAEIPEIETVHSIPAQSTIPTQSTALLNPGMNGGEDAPRSETSSPPFIPHISNVQRPASTESTTSEIQSIQRTEAAQPQTKDTEQSSQTQSNRPEALANVQPIQRRIIPNATVETSTGIKSERSPQSTQQTEISQIEAARMIQQQNAISEESASFDQGNQLAKIPEMPAKSLIQQQTNPINDSLQSHSSVESAKASDKQDKKLNQNQKDTTSLFSQTHPSVQSDTTDSLPQSSIQRTEIPVETARSPQAEVGERNQSDLTQLSIQSHLTESPPLPHQHIQRTEPSTPSNSPLQQQIQRSEVAPEAEAGQLSSEQSSITKQSTFLRSQPAAELSPSFQDTTVSTSFTSSSVSPSSAQVQRQADAQNAATQQTPKLYIQKFEGDPSASVVQTQPEAKLIAQPGKISETVDTNTDANIVVNADTDTIINLKTNVNTDVDTDVDAPLDAPSEATEISRFLPESAAHSAAHSTAQLTPSRSETNLANSPDASQPETQPAIQRSESNSVHSTLLPQVGAQPSIQPTEAISDDSLPVPDQAGDRLIVPRIETDRLADSDSDSGSKSALIRESNASTNESIPKLSNADSQLNLGVQATSTIQPKSIDFPHNSPVSAVPSPQTDLAGTELSQTLPPSSDSINVAPVNPSQVPSIQQFSKVGETPVETDSQPKGSSDTKPSLSEQSTIQLEPLPSPTIQPVELPEIEPIHSIPTQSAVSTKPISSQIQPIQRTEDPQLQIGDTEQSSQILSSRSEPLTSIQSIQRGTISNTNVDTSTGSESERSPQSIQRTEIPQNEADRIIQEPNTLPEKLASFDNPSIQRTEIPVETARSPQAEVGERNQSDLTQLSIQSHLTESPPLPHQHIQRTEPSTPSNSPLQQQIQRTEVAPEAEAGQLSSEQSSITKQSPSLLTQSAAELSPSFQDTTVSTSFTSSSVSPSSAQVQRQADAQNAVTQQTPKPPIQKFGRLHRWLKGDPSISVAQTQPEAKLTAQPTVAPETVDTNTDANIVVNADTDTIINLLNLGQVNAQATSTIQPKSIDLPHNLSAPVVPPQTDSAGTEPTQILPPSTTSIDVAPVNLSQVPSIQQFPKVVFQGSVSESLISTSPEIGADTLNPLIQHTTQQTKISPSSDPAQNLAQTKLTQANPIHKTHTEDNTTVAQLMTAGTMPPMPSILQDLTTLRPLHTAQAEIQSFVPSSLPIAQPAILPSVQQFIQSESQPLSQVEPIDTQKSPSNVQPSVQRSESHIEQLNPQSEFNGTDNNQSIAQDPIQHSESQTQLQLQLQLQSRSHLQSQLEPTDTSNSLSTIQSVVLPSVQRFIQPESQVASQLDPQLKSQLEPTDIHHAQTIAQASAQQAQHLTPLGLEAEQTDAQNSLPIIQSSIQRSKSELEPQLHTEATDVQDSLSIAQASVQRSESQSPLKVEQINAYNNQPIDQAPEQKTELQSESQSQQFDTEDHLPITQATTSSSVQRFTQSQPQLETQAKPQELTDSARSQSIAQGATSPSIQRFIPVSAQDDPNPLLASRESKSDHPQAVDHPSASPVVSSKPTDTFSNLPPNGDQSTSDKQLDLNEAALLPPGVTSTVRGPRSMKFLEQPAEMKSLMEESLKRQTQVKSAASSRKGKAIEPIRVAELEAINVMPVKAEVVNLKEEKKGQETDYVEVLAREIYLLLRQRIEIDRERSGSYYSGRFS